MSTLAIAGLAAIVTDPEFNPALPLDQIVFVQNARSDLGDLSDLTASIVHDGVKQPITVIREGNKFQLWLGHRRAEASRLAGKTTIPALICPPPTPAQFLSVQLVENLNHASMDSRDVYRACKELERLGLSRKEIATSLGRSEPSICRYLAADNVSEAARQAFLDGRLTLGQCYRISTAKHPEAVLAAFLAGKTHEQAERVDKPDDEVPKEKIPRVNIPMTVNNDKFIGGGIVSVVGARGQKIDYEQSEQLLKNALRQLKEAQDKGWSLTKAMSAWRAASAS